MPAWPYQVAGRAGRGWQPGHQKPRYYFLNPKTVTCGGYREIARRLACAPKKGNHATMPEQPTDAQPRSPLNVACHVSVDTRFGRLTTIGRPFAIRLDSGKRRPAVVCRCDCGTVTVAQVDRLRSGRKKSCGCYRRDHPPAHKHGQSKTRLYRAWAGIWNRCTNPNASGYRYYGARGIRVCREWSTFETFRGWALASGYREGLAINRIDGTGNYEPSNCEWVTPAQNNRRRAYNRLTPVTAQDIRRRFAAGESQPDLARDYECSQTTISAVVTGRSWAHE